MTALLVQILCLIGYTAGLSALWHYVGKGAGYKRGYDAGTSDNKATYRNGYIRGMNDGETSQKKIHARQERERLRRDECGRFKKL